jgi:transcription initiation factor IIE alpha subunit
MFMTYNDSYHNKFNPELGPTAQRIFKFIIDNPGSTKEDIARGTGLNIELIERILYTLRSRGILSYRLLFHYEVMERGRAL